MMVKKGLVLEISPDLTKVVSVVETISIFLDLLMIVEILAGLLEIFPDLTKDVSIVETVATSLNLSKFVRTGLTPQEPLILLRISFEFLWSAAVTSRFSKASRSSRPPSKTIALWYVQGVKDL